MEARLRVVEGRRARRRFVELARRFRGGHPMYVAPVTGEIAKILDPKRNPAFRWARQRLWVLEDPAGRPLGRVAATFDPRHEENLGERAGWFGFFDAESPEAAQRLLDTAWQWLADQGAATMLGPADPDTNHECGCLLEGFDELPFLMMPHHPPEYGAWIEAAGLEKAKDLLAFETDATKMPLERMRPIVQRSLERGGFRTEPITKRRLGTLIEVAREVYNTAWKENWGFLPMSAEEFAFEAEGLKFLLMRELAIVAWKDDRPAGFVLGLPDVNVALKKIDSRLFPFGILRLPFLLPRVGRSRTVALGVMPEFRGQGLDGVLVYELTQGAVRRKVHHSEMSWVLEDNEAMTRLARTFNGRQSRRYRIYRRPG